MMPNAGLGSEMAAASLADRDPQIVGSVAPPSGDQLRGRRWPRTPIVIALGLSLPLVIATGLAVQSAVVLLAVVTAIVSVAVPSVGLGVLAVMLPLREPSVIGPLGLNAILILAVAAGCGIRFAVERPRRAIDVGILLLIGYVLLSLLQIPWWYGPVPLERTQFAVAQFVQLAEGALLFVGATYVFSRGDPRPYFAIAVVSAVAAALLAVVMYANGGAFGLPLRGLFSPDTFAVRAVGPFGNPNYFGLFAALALTLVLGWFAASGGMPRLPLALAAGVLAAGVGLSYSRSALIAVFVGVIWLAWSHSRRAAIALAVAGMFAIVFAYPLFAEARLGLTWQDALSGAAYEAAAQSDAWRLGAVAVSGQLFLSDPVFGVGYGQYHFVSPRFLGDSPITFSHNAFLNVVAEQGIAGVLLFGAILAALARQLRHSAHAMGKPAMAVFAAFLAGSLFAEPVTSLQTSGMAFLIFAGVAAPWLRAQQSSVHPADP